MARTRAKALRRLCLFCLLRWSSPSPSHPEWRVNRESWRACPATDDARDSSSATTSDRAFAFYLFLPSLPRGGSQSSPSSSSGDRGRRDDVGPPRGSVDCPPPSSRSRRHHHQPPSPAKAKSLLGSLAQSSVSLTGRVLETTARQSARAALHVMRPKHVELPELRGLWRLDQDVRVASSSRYTSPSVLSLEIVVAGGALVTSGHVRVHHHTPPAADAVGGSSRVAPAWRDAPGGLRFAPSKSRLLAHATVQWIDPITGWEYRAAIHRKLADPAVLKLRGEIFLVRRRSREKVGTFVARRRLRFDDDDDDDDDEAEDAVESDDEDEGEGGEPMGVDRSDEEEAEVEEEDGYDHSDEKEG